MRVGVGRWWIGGLAVAIPALLFLLLFRPVREEVDAGYRGAARTNPYLATERLLTRLGAEAETVHGSLELPPPTATAIFLGSEPLPVNQDLDALLDWVSDGGRLVVTPAGAASFDALLAHFRLEVVRPESTEALPAEADTRGATETVEVDAPGERTPLRVAVPRGRRLVPREAEGSTDEPVAEASVLRRYALGAGEVYVLADGSFLRNEAIGRLDHARLAWALADRVHRSGNEPTRVILVVRDAVPSLAVLLARHAWPVLIAGALLLLAWLRLAMSRSGPALAEPSLDRRRLLEHVEAAGGFLWRQGGSAALVESTRRAVLARVHLREPAWETLPPEELARRAARASGLQPGPVERALFGPVPGDGHDFVHSIQTLETVRRSL